MEIIQSNIYRILPKDNQVIYTLDTICEPNIMILARVVLEIFCSQGSIGLQWESWKRVITLQRQVWRKEKYGSAYLSYLFHIWNFKILSLTVLDRMQSVRHHGPQTDWPKQKRKTTTKKKQSMQDKQTHTREAHRRGLSPHAPPQPPRARWSESGLIKHENNEQGKAQPETPRSKNRRATQNTNYTWITALERSVV